MKELSSCDHLLLVFKSLDTQQENKQQEQLILSNGKEERFVRDPIFQSEEEEEGIMIEDTEDHHFSFLV